MTTQPAYTSAPQLQHTVWTKDYELVGNVTRIAESHITIAANTTGGGSITVDDDDPQIAALTAPGARMVCSYRPRNSWAWEPLLSGRLAQTTGQGGETRQRTVSVIDDWTLFNELTCWPRPAQAITNQGGESVFWTQTGPAETVLKNAIHAAATRQGVAITIPASADLGDQVTVSLRFDQAVDKLFPLVDQAGLLVRVVQIGSQLTLLVTQPGPIRPVTEESGVIADHEFDTEPPTLTRCTVATGSATDSTQRAFREYVILADGQTVKQVGDLTSSDTTMETLWGFSASTFAEVSGDDGTLDQLMLQTARDTLLPAAGQLSLQLTLQETDHWQYAAGYQLGDLVPVQLAGSPLVTDRIRQVTFDQTRDGLVITPVVGAGTQADDSPTAELTKAVTKLARTVRTRQRSLR